MTVTRKTRALGFSLGVILVVGSPVTAQDLYADLLESGNSALDRGDIEIAIADLTVACFGLLASPPQLTDCRLALASAHDRVGDESGFREQYRNLLDLERRFGAVSALAETNPLKRVFLDAASRWLTPRELEQLATRSPRPETKLPARGLPQDTPAEVSPSASIDPEHRPSDMVQNSPTADVGAAPKVAKSEAVDPIAEQGSRPDPFESGEATPYKIRRRNLHRRIAEDPGDAAALRDLMLLETAAGADGDAATAAIRLLALPRQEQSTYCSALDVLIVAEECREVARSWQTCTQAPNLARATRTLTCLAKVNKNAARSYAARLPVGLRSSQEINQVESTIQ